jgi:hypothetical protein
MNPVFYVIAILGCSDGSQICQQQRVEPIRYETPAACQAAMPAALERNTDLDFPTIEAACQANGPTIAREQTSHQQRG